MKSKLLLVGMLAAVAGWLAATAIPHFSASRPGIPAAASTTISTYQCPMHPWVKADKPGECTICGMNLAPVDARGNSMPGRPAAGDQVMLPLDSVRVAGVRTLVVAVQPLHRTLRVTGMIGEDETRHGIVCAPVEGRIDGLAMNCEGQGVHTLEPFATIFSRTLLAGANDYRRAVKAGGPPLEEATRALLQDGLEPQQIAAIPSRQAEDIHFGLLAHLSGTIVKSYVNEGQYVYKGQKLFELADLSRLWFEFTVYEQDLPWLHRDQIVTISTDSLPGETYEAKVDFIEPSLAEGTRSGRVRVVVENRDGRFRNNTLAEGMVETDTPAVLSVPRSAVLWPGSGPRVYVESTAGIYEPRAVTLGRAGDTDWEVLAGLRAGERVVVAGNFLLDSEAQLNQEARGDAPGTAK